MIVIRMHIYIKALRQLVNYQDLIALLVKGPPQ